MWAVKKIGTSVAVTLAVTLAIAAIPKVIVKIKEKCPYINESQILMLEKGLPKLIRLISTKASVFTVIRGIYHLISPKNASLRNDIANIINSSIIFLILKTLDKSPTKSSESLPSFDINLKENHNFESEKETNKFSKKLIKKFGIKKDIVDTIPLNWRPYLLQTLQTKPLCSISFEEVLDKGKIRDGILVLFQTNIIESTHQIYIYDKEYFDQWFEDDVPHLQNKNSENRDIPIDFENLYFIIS